MTVSLKVFRQRLMHAMIVANIEREGLRIDTAAVRSLVDHDLDYFAGIPTQLAYVQVWARIVDTNDVAAVKTIAERDDETGNEMRNRSPLRVLLTESERLQVIDQLREYLAG
ncbi:hypothetical protein [Rhodococcus sp. (in: high G+C Gram-positive bacteria)]|uniref:hypothetical protein n=1 Tax=Rhodococcus sp. TaxID=1831 RepID=UPI003B8A7D97